MKKFIANITIETKTPLKIGSKSVNFLQDSPVQKDWNNLPMISGSSLSGVFRSNLGENLENKSEDNEYVYRIFGDDINEQYNKKYKGLKNKEDIQKNAQGSKVIFSNALLCDEFGKVCESLLNIKSKFLSNFTSLPKRDHTAITARGAAKEHSKFDEEVVFKGSRFRFNLELLALENITKYDFEKLLDLLFKNSFRLGGGSTKGFGQIKVIKITYDEFDTNSKAYENFTNTLNADFSNIYKTKNIDDEKYKIYKISLTPDDFYMFGGWYDNDADNSFVLEKVVNYDSNVANLNTIKILIPASSIKGALHHRSIFHLNKLEKNFIDESKDKTKSLKMDEIFGKEKNNNSQGSKGKVLFLDLFLKYENNTKIFDHVSIDRFTGGGIDGALFQEKTLASKESLIFEILLDKSIIGQELKAFENALDDLCNGMLPLGGATTKGHGFFHGKWSKNDR